ncbi:hypothetical protein OG308_03250 [Nocardia salmonicida]|uniref:Uncharacterized protein n=1 Tax=Nocardia salmonicida TaxID=53431 RepID=A0ABZ1NAC8_9NOCA
MNLKLQLECDALVRRYAQAFAELRRDVTEAVMRVAEVWEPDFDEPTNLHGQQLCTDVRGLTLQRRIRREGTTRPSLSTRCGQGMSVMLEDGHGLTIRVRKAPAEVLADHERLVVYPSSEQKARAADIRAAVAAKPKQLTLGPDFDALQQDPTGYQWFVLWTLSEDAVQVPEVFLAAVLDIDSSSRVTVLASTPLPRLAGPVSGHTAVDDDFEEFRGQAEEGSGPEPA